MGKLDRRNSLKMKRRKAQAKKKVREERPAKKVAEAAAPVKKTRAPKAAAAPASE